MIARRTLLAALVTTHAVYSKPVAGATRLGRITAKGYYTREQTVLPVLGHRIGANGQRWLLVSLPGRPNGHSGWIAQRATIAKSTPWHIVVDLRGLGTAGSHGCVRLSTKMMRWLALRMGPGTPVTITS